MDSSIIDEETFLFIYKNVCIFNNVEYTDEDITDPDIQGDNYMIIYLINKVCKEIVIKTNRNQFPKDLKYLVTDLVNNAFSAIKADHDPSTNQNINSMSEAGRSVSFGATDSWKTKYQMLLDQQMKTNETLINKYKLLYKVECPYGES